MRHALGTGALAAPLLRRVADDHATYRPDSAARLATVAMDLIGTAVAERAGRTDALPEEARRRTLLQQAHAFIEERLGDPGLDPAAIAAACHISVRYLLVQGAFADRSDPVMAAIAAGLSRWFTVYAYDRRGRGDSGDTAPYAVEREVEDLAAVIGAAGGTAMVFGGSSGAALALEAAAVTSAVTHLAVWEPPYHVDDSAPPLPGDFAGQLGALVAAGRRGEVVERFMVEAAEVPLSMLDAMRGHPSWAAMEAVAHTLVYEAAVLGPGNALPAARLAGLTQPTLVLNGGESPA
ncbi:alpha/beta fold hydrolase [Nonomuraea sp. NPDC004580]|uniref:alpha/beta fold hydrolase n=1 Tax=Nonomuraea sp. NPDC004580 TaxID=3154552 RepID=UPI0033BD958B